MRAVDGNTYTIAATGASPIFNLSGGLYQFAGHSATWNAGNAALQQLLPDNTTWLGVGTALSADGVNTVNLPPGEYRFNVTTTVVGVIAVTRIPGE